MKLEQLDDVDRAEARERFLEYKRSVHTRHDEEMTQIMRGYREIARGHQVIDMAATIRAGGVVRVRQWRWDSEIKVLLPALAVMRADQPWCWVETSSDGRCSFWPDRGTPPHARRNVVRLPAGTVVPSATVAGIVATTHRSHRAMVPPVPPRFMPTIGLGNFHVLFEAEWEPRTPKDPALLRHIGGDLYAVLAQWDLTEIERTVLAGRFR